MPGAIHLPDITPPEYAAPDAVARRQLRTAGVVAAREKEFVRKDGSRVPVLVGGAAIDAGGDGRERLDRIIAGARRMSEIIDALLSLARLSRTEPRREPVDLAQLAHKVIEQLRAGEPGRSVEFVSAGELIVDGDPELLRLLLDNLLGNAWKFTGKQPAPRVELGRDTSNGSPVYYVRDNGAGFDMAFVDKLFSPFKRLHGASEFAGTGIGLATVQRIVRRHGGRVWADGAKARGATIHFTLTAEPRPRSDTNRPR
jgi:signal transduction histidine kinase